MWLQESAFSVNNRNPSLSCNSKCHALDHCEVYLWFWSQKWKQRNFNVKVLFLHKTFMHESVSEDWPTFNGSQSTTLWRLQYDKSSDVCTNARLQQCSWRRKEIWEIPVWAGEWTYGYVRHVVSGYLIKVKNSCLNFYKDPLQWKLCF